MSTGNLSKWKNGNVPKIDTIIKIVQYFNISIDYFFNNDFENNSDMNQTVGVSSVLSKIPVFCDSNLSIIHNNDNCDWYKYGDIDNNGEYFYLKVSDNAMSSFGIVSGSLVLIKRQVYVNDNEIVCYINKDKISIRRFVLKKNVVILISDNVDSETFVLDSIDDFYKTYIVLGVAKEVKTELN